MKGLATMCMSARLEVSPRLGSCLEVPMISGGKTSVSGTRLNADQTLSSNDNYSAGGGAIINANVEAVGSISGSTYNGSRLAKLQPRDMPDKLNALNYYLASGTTIRHTDLSLWSQHEMLTNTKFETDVSGWYATGGTCTIQQSSAQAKDGNFSMLVSKRSAAAAVAGQDISLGLIMSGNTYELLIPVFPSAACTAQAVLTITSTGSGMQTFATPAVTLQKNASGVFVWQNLWGYVKPIWTGTLTKATVSVSMSVKNNYYMDKVSMIDTSYPRGAYVMDRQLLSPSVNPFGSQQTNANGIYIVNCGGKDVVVGRMRIVGTLVFVNPGSNSDITGPVVWEPAIYNFPAVLSDDTINMTFDSSALSEEFLGVNLNPPGTPYPFIGGVSNETQTDTYPSRVTGLIYSKRDLKLKGAPVLSGIVITDRDLSIEGTICSMTFGNVYLNDPPPGFDVGSIEMKDVPGTWKRTVQ